MNTLKEKALAEITECIEELLVARDCIENFDNYEVALCSMDNAARWLETAEYYVERIENE